MAENRVEANAHNAGGCPASNAIHGHINDFLVRTGLRSGVSELQLPCFTAVRAEIALMSGSAFAVTHHALGSRTGGTTDGSHRSTSKTPSYTKSVSWQHHPARLGINISYFYNEGIKARGRSDPPGQSPRQSGELAFEFGIDNRIRQGEFCRDVKPVGLTVKHGVDLRVVEQVGTKTVEQLFVRREIRLPELVQRPLPG